ncbi:hypothetical protein, partial [Effusibacillus consociatus]
MRFTIAFLLMILVLTGCSEQKDAINNVTPAEKTETTSASLNLKRIRFFNPSVGWGVNDNGHILRTEHGGKEWKNVTPKEVEKGEGSYTYFVPTLKISEAGSTSKGNRKLNPVKL